MRKPATKRRSVRRPSAPRASQDLRSLTIRAKTLSPAMLRGLDKWAHALQALGGKSSASEASAPTGLTAAFKLIAMDGDTSTAASTHAARAYPYALQIIDHLNGRISPRASNDTLIEMELLAAARHLFPSVDDSDPAEVRGTVAEAGFMVGYAVCWLLMRSVSGQDGER